MQLLRYGTKPTGMTDYDGSDEACFYPWHLSMAL